MRVSEILKDLSQELVQDVRLGSDATITGIVDDSRKAGAGKIFVAIRGTKGDGHAYVRSLTEANLVAAVVVEGNIEGDGSTGAGHSKGSAENSMFVDPNFIGAVICVADTRVALDRLAAAFYGHPSRKLVTIGVTGTNGKTTTTNFLEKIFEHAGKPCGVMGTVDHHIGKRVWTASLTTPGPIELQARLKDFVACAGQAVAMEVSSHAIDQGRANSVNFDAAIFTNLTQDHLDYHVTMENYYLAKKKLFSEVLGTSEKKNPVSVINVNSKEGERLANELASELAVESSNVHSKESKRNYPKVVRFGEERNVVRAKGTSLSYKILNQNFEGTKFQFVTDSGERVDVDLHLPCRHNVENAAGAAAAAWAVGIPLKAVAEGLSALRGVSGRLESVPNTRGLHVYVDYAHTDQALVNVLSALKSLRDEAGVSGRIVTVFGCGGDRDKTKRPLMGKAAFEGSEMVVVTSDNPRTEDRMVIIGEILTGIPKEAVGKNVFIESDRRKAIGLAISRAKKGDVVVIAGKGHEQVQIVGDQRLSFNDVEVAGEFLK